MPFFDSIKAGFKDLKAEGQKLMGSSSDPPPQQPYPQQQQGYYYGQPPPPQPQYNRPPPPPSQGSYPGQQAQAQRQQTYSNYPPPTFSPPPPQQQYGAPPPQGPPPQFASATGPPQQPIQGVYWSARFDPNSAVSQEWEEKQGNNNGWGNNELQHYTNQRENSFFTGNNLLVLRAISNPSHPDPAQKYTSARLVSRQRLARPRGSLVATLTLPSAPGIWPAFWLLPYEPFTWPTDGEIDIAETWNGDGINHSCLHWGQFTPEDNWKHRVVGSFIPGMQQGRPVRFEFAWDQNEQAGGQGRMVWYIDGRPVMKASIPQGTRKMADFNILLNIAMGGNVTQGKTPAQGVYDFVVYDMKMLDQPENGGWQKFDHDFHTTREGDTM
ncbi:hypothetical protein PV10_08618 [Exophiala mesophila]|uniref:GH16 domain-containing protein n=1 Tax=Exophiala mesophila TaxID=212818 RepID=A0A0D1Z2N7_EXOME|nr:uncharacterized protein PV10_08618 [Exophiala mesophila]KIV88997.1 hypothetical protein PV10_08618 [Exophiala mesophila]